MHPAPAESTKPRLPSQVLEYKLEVERLKGQLHVHGSEDKIPAKASARAELGPPRKLG